MWAYGTAKQNAKVRHGPKAQYGNYNEEWPTSSKNVLSNAGSDFFTFSLRGLSFFDRRNVTDSEIHKTKNDQN